MNPTVAFRVYLILYFGMKVAFIFSGTDLFTEEAQYWLWSRYPDWSYYSKPPLIAWVNYLTDVFPPSDVVIRFTALSFGVVTLLVYYRLSLLLFGSARVAALAVVILSVSPYFILASTFFTTDSLVIFFWILTFYLLIIAMREDTVSNWLLVGLALGFGLLSKYVMFFLLLVMIPLWRAGQRAMKGLAVAIAVSLVVFIPVLVWNVEHDWVTVRHVGALATPRSTVAFQNSWRYVLEFAGGVILINSPFILLMFAEKKFRAALFQGTDTNEKNNVALLVFPMIGTVAVFLVVSLFKRTEVNWPAVAYSTLPLVLAYGAGKASLCRRAIAYSGVTMVAVTLFLFPVLFDAMKMPGLLPVKRDSMKRLAGWSYLASEVSKLQKADATDSWLLTDSYHVASELAFYTRQQNVLCLNLGRRMNQFDIWSTARTDMPASITALYVTELPAIDPSVSFGSLGGHAIIPIHYRGEVVRRYHVYVLRDLRLKEARGFTAF